VTPVQSDGFSLGSVRAVSIGTMESDAHSQRITTLTDLNVNMVAVPPGAAVVFEVSLELDCSLYATAQGTAPSVEADFDTGDGFGIVCPYVLVSLVHPPPILHP
jgi:hypothetical protein